jgi:uncharacterized protein YkwD
MKNSVFIIFFIFCVGNTFAQYRDTLFTATGLPFFLKQTAIDSTLKLEYLTSVHFHTLLNEYRIKKKLKTYNWDDTLWLAARNHSVWMAENNRLTHLQRKESPFFSGASYTKRIAFIDGGYRTPNVSGENTLYNFVDCSECDMETKAKKVAEICFNQWRNSQGHHQNMINKEFVLHAVAFIFDEDDKVWATDLFLDSKKNYKGKVKPQI